MNHQLIEASTCILVFTVTNLSLTSQSDIINVPGRSLQRYFNIFGHHSQQYRWSSTWWKGMLFLLCHIFLRRECLLRETHDYYKPLIILNGLVKSHIRRRVYDHTSLWLRYHSLDIINTTPSTFSGFLFHSKQWYTVGRVKWVSFVANFANCFLNNSQHRWSIALRSPPSHCHISWECTHAINTEFSRNLKTRRQ